MKPFVAYIAQQVVESNMRKTLLGKRTWFGISPLAGKMVTSLDLLEGNTDEKKRREILDELAENGMKDLRDRLTENEFEEVRSELALTNLDYWTCVLRLLQANYVFYAVAILHQLFAAFAVRRSRPSGAGLDPCGTLAAAFEELTGTNSSVDVDAEMDAFAVDATRVAAHARWMHVAPAAAFALDSTLRVTFEEYDDPDAPASYLVSWLNWTMPGECSASALVGCLA